MTNITQTPAYRVAFSMYVALGGDKTRIFDSVEAIYAEIDKFYGKGSRITTEALTLEITENRAELYNDDAITGYKPVSINVNVPQKYTDEQVEELKESSRQQGYDSGYDKGIADGYVQGESEGYTDGYTEGLEDGAEDQKALLEDITIVENGVYEKEDGYKKVTVEVPIPEIPVFETEELSVELTTNGSYNYTPTTDGYSKVSVTVDVDTSGGGGKPKIYNGFYMNAGTYAERLADIDFSLYDWSRVYDLKYFFSGFKSRTSGSYGWISSDFDNFVQNYNGKILSGYEMFKPATGAASYAPLGYVPDFSKFSSEMLVLDGMFKECKNLISAENIGNWDTSNVVSAKEMFYNCSKLTAVPYFNTSKIIDMNNMFYYCEKLASVPQFNTANATNMNNMFRNCYALTSIPQLNTSNVTDVGYMVYYCKELTSIPQLDFSNVKTVGSMISGCTKLTDLGGFVNYGKINAVDNTFDISASSNLTHDAIMNVINNLYDRKTAGFTAVKTIKFGSTNLAKITDEEKAIATNKGWTLS